MLGKRDRAQEDLFVACTLRELVPDDYVLKRVDKVLDFSWLREEVRELYDLQADVAETTDLYDNKPDVVAEMLRHVDAAREDLGDAAVGAEGRCRPIGRVEQGVTLTEYHPDDPYIISEYDLPQRG